LKQNEFRGFGVCPLFFILFPLIFLGRGPQGPLWNISNPAHSMGWFKDRLKAKKWEHLFSLRKRFRKTVYPCFSFGDIF